MVTPAAVAEAIRDYGVDLRPYPFDDRPWHTFTTSGGWSPIGVMHHHTTGAAALLSPNSAAQQNMLRLLRDGYTGLPGPLPHFAPTYLGPGKRVAYAIGWGNCNHAGVIAGNIVTLVAAQIYTGQPPGVDTTDGNPLFYGLEYLHPGDATPWPDELLDTGHRIGAALCDVHGWPASVNLEHREATSRKPDRSWNGNLRPAIQRIQEAAMPTPEENAQALLNTIINPKAPEADRVTVRTVLKRLNLLLLRKSPTPPDEALLRSIAAGASSQTVADVLAGIAPLLAVPQPAEPQPGLTAAQVRAEVVAALREVLGGLDN